MFKYIVSFIISFSSSFASGPTELTSTEAVKKAHEMMSQHPIFKEINTLLGKRILQTYCEQMDSLKIYLLQKEVKEWIDPSDDFVKQVITSFEAGNFEVFETMLATTQKAIARTRLLEERLVKDTLPKVGEFNPRELTWVRTEEELYERLRLIRSVQVEAASQLDPSMYQIALQRIQKRKAKFEEAREVQDPVVMKKTVATFVIKAFAEALDSESAYFTPNEAKQLLINMQQKLFGIGVVLRDDVDGFSVVKIVEGGPADRQGGLELGDRVIAVNGDPVMGFDLMDVVENIRGLPETTVALRILRKKEGSIATSDLQFTRGKVVVRDLRYGTKLEPFQEGVLAYLSLHSFYQDEDTSSYEDLLASLETIQKEHVVKGVILDLRYNPGGLLSQAVAVSGLFMDRGIVVSIQDGDKRVCHMRNIASKKAWDGPLVILVNRASASASEIVAQALQDWGRAIIVGDDRSFGKGSFQLFTLSVDSSINPSPQGEYKVTRGRYYTVSGKSPQLVGVASDVVVPGVLSYVEIGEEFNKFPLPADKMSSNFEDTFADVPTFHKKLLERLYENVRQVPSTKWTKYLPELKRMAEGRLAKNEGYKNFLAESKKRGIHQTINDNPQPIDFQLEEAWNVVKDLVQMAGGEKQTARAA